MGTIQSVNPICLEDDQLPLYLIRTGLDVVVVVYLGASAHMHVSLRKSHRPECNWINVFC